METISINTKEIPEYARNQIAEATLAMVLRVIRQPDGREMIEKKKAELRAAGVI